LATRTKTSKPVLHWLTLVTIVAVLILAAASVRADGTEWEHLSEGDGTAFEERWAVRGLIESASTPDSYMVLGVNNVPDNRLNVYVAGLQSNCTYSEWEVAIDRTQYEVTGEMSTDEDGMLLKLSEADYEEFWSDFLTGSRLAVRFDSECEDTLVKLFLDEEITEFRNKTLVFSLSGSSAVVEHILGGGS
jgi:hypothetical protein